MYHFTVFWPRTVVLIRFRSVQWSAYRKLLFSRKLHRTYLHNIYVKRRRFLRLQITVAIRNRTNKGIRRGWVVTKKMHYLLFKYQSMMSYLLGL
jgi:hypothetical protein